MKLGTSVVIGSSIVLTLSGMLLGVNLFSAVFCGFSAPLPTLSTSAANAAFIATLIFIAATLGVLSGKLYLTNRRMQLAFKTLKDENTCIENQRRQLEESNKTKEKMFSLVAHDLRAPLATLKSYSGLISTHLEQLSHEDIRELGSQVNRAVDNTIKMTDNLLTWARLQQKQIDVRLETFNVAEIVNDVCTIYSHAAGLKRVALRNHVGREITVTADRNQLTFMLRNLVNNAIKYTHSGGWVEINCHRLSKGGVVLMVSDNGVGIPKEIRRNLFKAGKVTSVSGTEGERGTGLGLLLAAEFAKLNSARIEFDTAEELGSTFRIIFS